MNALGRPAVIVNLDPGNENVPYQAAVDIRELVAVPVVMEEMGLGINGALVCGALLAVQAHRVEFECGGDVFQRPTSDACVADTAWNTLLPIWTGCKTG